MIAVHNRVQTRAYTLSRFIPTVECKRFISTRPHRDASRRAYAASVLALTPRTSSQRASPCGIVAHFGASACERSLSFPEGLLPARSVPTLPLTRRVNFTPPAHAPLRRARARTRVTPGPAGRVARAQGLAPDGARGQLPRGLGGQGPSRSDAATGGNSTSPRSPSRSADRCFDTQRPAHRIGTRGRCMPSRCTERSVCLCTCPPRNPNCSGTHRRSRCRHNRRHIPWRARTSQRPLPSHSPAGWKRSRRTRRIRAVRLVAAKTHDRGMTVAAGRARGVGARGHLRVALRRQTFPRGAARQLPAKPPLIARFTGTIAGRVTAEAVDTRLTVRATRRSHRTLMPIASWPGMPAFASQ